MINAYLGCGIGHLTHNLLERSSLLHLFLVVQRDFLAEFPRIRSHLVGAVLLLLLLFRFDKCRALSYGG